MKKQIDELEKVTDERKVELPYEVWEAIRTIEDHECYGDDADALKILGNFETGVPEIDRLIEEIYEFGKLEAEVWEFAYSLELGKKEEGPSFRVGGVEGKVYPYFDGVTLRIQGHEVGLQVELVTFEEGDFFDAGIIAEAIFEYMEGE